MLSYSNANLIPKSTDPYTNFQIEVSARPGYGLKDAMIGQMLFLFSASANFIGASCNYGNKGYYV